MEKGNGKEAVNEFLKAIQLANIKGVGVVTVAKILAYAQENGYAV